MTDRFAFTNYAEIPVMMSEYIMTVAGIEKIETVALDDINGFFNGLDQFEAEKEEREEYEDGWVL